MNRARCILILFVLLGFGVSLAIPAEDVRETAYDESETLPYEGTPLFSVVAPQASDQTGKAKLQCGSLLPFNGLMNRCNGRRENNGRLHRFSDSLATLNHSLRC